MGRRRSISESVDENHVAVEFHRADVALRALWPVDAALIRRGAVAGHGIDRGTAGLGRHHVPDAAAADQRIQLRIGSTRDAAAESVLDNDQVAAAAARAAAAIDGGDDDIAGAPDAVGGDGIVHRQRGTGRGANIATGLASSGIVAEAVNRPAVGVADIRRVADRPVTADDGVAVDGEEVKSQAANVIAYRPAE